MCIRDSRGLIVLYWDIGRSILTRQSLEGWGAKVVERLSTDLRREFRDLQGLSARNLQYMRAFAEAYPDAEIVQRLVAQLPWGHNVTPVSYTHLDVYKRQALG